MKTNLKRIGAWVLCFMLLLSCIPVSADDGLITARDYSADFSLEDQLNTEAETITVTLRINNTNYTSDPTSGETHLTTTAAIDGSDGVTYESWSGVKNTYKVKGTGIVCTYTIPAGTSLAQNGTNSLILFTTNNIGSSNQYSYESPYSWVDANGMVCSVNTVFEEDTTLYLQLYQTDERYYLNFVCGEEENHSIVYGSPDFLLGQSISQGDIDAATEKANAYEYVNCSHVGQTVTGWQLKKSDGEKVSFEAGMPITADYVYEESSHVVKAYAVWEAAPVTARFQVRIDDGDPETDDKVIELESATKSHSAGDPLGELPDVSAFVSEYEEFGYELLGWEYTDSEGETHPVTSETVITEDTTYTAVIGVGTYYEVNLYDILPGGSEADAQVSLQLLAGTLLRDELTYCALDDGTFAADCIWHNGENGSVVDLDNPVESIIDTEAGETYVDLYTYTYQVVLTISPQDAEQAISTLSLVEVGKNDEGNLTLTITAREGESLSAADFVDSKTGVDYSLYTWTYTDTNGDVQTLNIQELIQNGLTEDIIATSDGRLNTTTGTKTINFYLCIDDVWTRIATRTMEAYWLTGESGGDSWFLTSAQLQSVYGKYGFSGMASGTKFFPNAETGNATIWGNRPAVEDDNGVVYSPIMNTQDTTSCDVYYLPAQNVNYSGGKNDDDVKAGNVFYTVTVVDPTGTIYALNELPETTYTLTGGTVTTTVNTPANVTWQCIGRTNSNSIEGAVNAEEETTTFTISGINQPYVISPVFALEDGQMMLTYDLNLPGTPSDPEYGTPLVQDRTLYSEIIDLPESESVEYVVEQPSLLTYFYTYGKYLGEATFLGWQVYVDGAAQDELTQSGETLIFGIQEHAQKSIRLVAQWDTKLGGTNETLESPMVNFFVALNAVSEGTKSWIGNTQTDKFTQSVYTTSCGITGQQAKDKGLYSEISGNQYFVLGGTSGTDLNGNHSTIVSNLSAGYTKLGNDGLSYTYQASFPSDETVLRNIRSMVASGTSITINGHKITPEELTTANFTVKWYVFKYDTSDGWHIDGILVAKSGEMIVKKTFAGDAAAIAAVKSNFSINVSGQEGAVHSGMDCMVSNADSVSGNTYTWKVPVDQYYTYTVEESDYAYTGDESEMYTSNNLVRVTNSTTEGQNTGGWTDGISTIVTGRGHNEDDDERLTVAFLNTYTAPGTVILRKVDAATGNLMPNVSFTIAKVGDENFSMYDNGNGSYSAEGYGTTTITTDSTGQAYLYIGGGTYTLQESVPTGYDNPGTITMELDGTEDNSYEVVSIKNASAANASEGRAFVTHNGTGLVVTVKNYSRTVDLTVTKNWADGENKPVTIQLYRNGNPLGSDYTVTFDGVTDSTENPAWSYTFKNLPLYADGGAAQYTLREEALGDFKYSDAYSDGYQYYDVTYSDMTYLDADGTVTTDMTKVETIALSVTNKRSSGALSINKVDDTGAALAGATFYLYSAEGVDGVPGITEAANGTQTLDGLTFVGSATSDASGTVSFGTKPAGVYYLVEHQAPQHYEASNSVYRLTLSGSNDIKMEVYANGAWTTVPGKSVVNTRLTRDVVITKRVTGNMGDVNKLFGFTVTSTEAIGAPQTDDSYTLGDDGTTASFSLKSSQRVTLRNVPIGARLTITETGADGYTMTVDHHDSGEGNENRYTIPEGNDDVQITVTNDNTATIDTGVTLDFLPYVLLIVGVGIAVALWLVMSANKRKDD